MKYKQLAAFIILALMIVACTPKIEEPVKTNEEQTPITEEPIKEETQKEPVESEETSPEETIKEEIIEEEQAPIEKPVSDSSLAKIFANKAKSYTITYDFDAGEGVQEITTTTDGTTIATQVLINGDETRMIYDGEFYFACNQGESDWTCFKSSSTQSVSQNEQLEKIVEDESTTTKNLGSCTVAGEKGTRFEVTSDDYTSTSCVTQDGILLESITSESTMKATKVSRDPNEDLFEPPVAPIDLTNR